MANIILRYFSIAKHLTLSKQMAHKIAYTSPLNPDKNMNERVELKEALPNLMGSRTK